MTKVEVLPFDTDLFGFKTGLLSLGKISHAPESLIDELNEARSKGFKLIYIKYQSPSEILFDCPGVHFFYDTKVTFSQIVDSKSFDGLPPHGISKYTRDMPINSQLCHLAYTSGQYSRFMLDTNFPKDAFTKMYDLWLQKSLNGEIASAVYVYEENGVILGFITIDTRVENTCRIGLLGVDERAQGKGIGKKLIAATINEARIDGRKLILVDTQERNEQACGFYLRTGFEIYNKEYTTNCWLN